MDVVTLALSKNYTNKAVEKIAAGLQYKGSIEFASLPTAAAANKGWLYTVTNKNNHEYVSDGTTWIDLGDEIENKQDKLVSGTNIKRLNGDDILGSGDIVLNGVPSLPDDASSKTYTLQTVNGILTWVETSWIDKN